MVGTLLRVPHSRSGSGFGPVHRDDVADRLAESELFCFRDHGQRTSQSPVPGLVDSKFAFSGLSSHSFASGGGSCLTVMFGQTRAYSALMLSHFSSPASVSGLIASTGHSGSQTPQSMHSSG